jgi:hypothetical protein
MVQPGMVSYNTESLLYLLYIHSYSFLTGFLNQKIIKSLDIIFLKVC